MISRDQVRDLAGSTAYDQNEEKIGKISQVFCDDQTGEPEFVTVNTGLFGTSETFVPISNATFDGDRVLVAFDKSLVSDAPRVTAEDGHLSQEEEEHLYRHYGLERSEQPSDSGLPAGQAPQPRPAADDSGAMTRSEEELRVGTEQVQAGRARLRKYVVTEEQQVPVTTTREEVRVEREPITGADREGAVTGSELGEEDQEIILHREQPVVQTEAVPVERVRLGKEQVTEEQTVSGEVRKERIDIDTDTDRKPAS
ncbi:MAG: PRC and DUF2382 domain-containing protein [Pseudonocardiales bacterium]